jgi:hypothetical protein
LKKLKNFFDLEQFALVDAVIADPVIILARRVHNGKSMIPFVERCIPWPQLAQASDTPSRDQLALQIAFSVF